MLGRKLKLAIVFGFAIAVTGLSHATSPALLNIYISPSGSDANNGLSAKTPILTLKKANSLVLKQLQTKPSNILVNIAPGTYFNQSVIWTAVHKNFYVNIKGTHPTSRPKFDGRLNAKETLGSLPSFFTLKASGALSNLTIENIQVSYYTEAISFSGNREDIEKGFNGNNKILFSVFDKIGTKYVKDKSRIGYAVVRFVNSRFNIVKGNIFSNLYNGSKNEYQHALYVSNESSHNLIAENAFRSNGGDPVRIRDYSNFNKIERNEFDRAGAYGYSEWYCEKKIESACTKVNPECPSWGNSFRYNNLKSVSSFKLYINPSYSMSKSACKRPAPAEAAGKRVSTGANVTNATVMVTSILNGGMYSNFCSATNDCVSSSGKCYKTGKGTTRWLCDVTRWRSCSGSADVGRVYQGVTCRGNATAGYGWAY